MEIWKNVIGYDKYMVSNLGRVKSVKFNKEKILKLALVGRQGNQYLNAHLSQNGKAKMLRVHKLVAMAFMGHDPNKSDLIIDHINNDKFDNRLENLQLITQRENASKDKANKTSKYTGVSWHKHTNKWTSQIQIKDKKVYLGVFKCEFSAFAAYQKAKSLIL